jgi:uncharacterized protein YuzE
MKITYFKDTDTLLVNFNENQISETRDFTEDVLVELDPKGNLVSMTIEHASQKANMSDFSFNQLNQPLKTASIA